jgi:hypothetical protein
MSDLPKNTVKVPVKHRLATFSDPLEYKIESQKTLELTKAKAFEFLDLLSFSGERSVREHHVQFLYDEWQAGRFLWHNVQLAAARLNGQLYRINGQHSSWMRVNIPDKCEPVKEAIVAERIYIVDSEEQLRNLYSAFDRAAPRSVSHISRVMLIGTDAARDIPYSYLNKLVAGFRVFFAEDWNTANVNPNQLTGLINKSYCELFNVVGRFFQIHYDEAPRLKKAAVVGSMFATFEKNVMASTEFWGPVWSNVGHSSKSDPRWKLRTFIDSHSQSSQSKTNIGTEDLYRACINTWNRWRAGDSVDVVRTTDKRLKARG